MADFQPTSAQKAAIEARGGAVLVSAGAGSGKTKVLTERLMKYILDEDHPVSISTFVIITFTKAAAAELKGRITSELSRAASDGNTSPEKENIFVASRRCARRHRSARSIPSARLSCGRTGMNWHFRLISVS